MWIQQVQGKGQMTDSREQKKEPSCSVKNGDVLDWLGDYLVGNGDKKVTFVQP